MKEHGVPGVGISVLVVFPALFPGKNQRSFPVQTDAFRHDSITRDTIGIDAVAMCEHRRLLEYPPPSRLSHAERTIREADRKGVAEGCRWIGGETLYSMPEDVRGRFLLSAYVTCDYLSESGSRNGFRILSARSFNKDFIIDDERFGATGGGPLLTTRIHVGSQR